MNTPSIVALALVWLSVIGTADAQTPSPSEVVDEVRRITRITDDAVRLRAFDALAESLSVDRQRRTIGEAGDWRITEHRSKIDDSRTVVLTLHAEEEVLGWPNKRTRPTLIVRYREGRIESYIWLGLTPNVERAEGATITVRFDDNEASDIRGSLSTDREAVFLPDAKSFIRSIAGSERMILRFTPFNSNPVVTEFDIRDFLAAVRPLEEASGWYLDDQMAHLEERLLQQWRREFGRLYSTTVNRSAVTTVVEGNAWKPWARDDGATERILDTLRLVTAASQLWLDARFRITVHGTTYRERKSSDGAEPFTSQQLGTLARTAMAEAGWRGKRYELVIGKEQDPERYGDDALRILRGKVKSTGETVVIEVLGVGE